jgi:hypothetical protein
MRIGAPLLITSYLLLGVPQAATATGKIKIEIVEATTTVGLVPHTNPGSPERITTNCDTRVHSNSARTDCDSTVTPATDPSSSLLPQILSFEVKAIFPDGSHVKLMCFPWPPSHLSKECGGVTPIAGSTLDAANCFLDAMVTNAPAVGTTKSCAVKNIGSYRAEYDKNLDVVIYGPKRKVRYQIKGSW